MATITSIVAPKLLPEFRWSQPEFALVGALSLVMSLFIPVAGRLVDLLGVRRTAAIGVTPCP